MMIDSIRFELDLNMQLNIFNDRCTRFSRASSDRSKTLLKDLGLTDVKEELQALFEQMT